MKEKIVILSFSIVYFFSSFLNLVCKLNIIIEVWFIVIHIKLSNLASMCMLIWELLWGTREDV